MDRPRSSLFFVCGFFRCFVLMSFVLILPAFITIQTLCVNTMFIEMYDSY